MVQVERWNEAFYRIPKATKSRWRKKQIQAESFFKDRTPRHFDSAEDLCNHVEADGQVLLHQEDLHNGEHGFPMAIYMLATAQYHQLLYLLVTGTTGEDVNNLHIRFEQDVDV